MYPFNNQEDLPTLKSEGQEEVLTYTTPTEKAVVNFQADGNVVDVVHTDLTTGEITIIENNEAKYVEVGTENCTRDVYHYLRPNPKAHLQLRLGLTIHRGKGTWSSLPHSFENFPQANFEETFFYLLKGGTQRGVQIGQGQWCDGSKADAVWQISDRTFSTIPLGYHPVVGEPDVEVRYIWAYLAKKKSGRKSDEEAEDSRCHWRNR